MSATQPAEQTTVGNYFISNYPPFAFWQKERAGEALAALERSPAPDTSLGVYVHIPFCRKRCHFCYFRVYTDKDSLQIKSYLDALGRELEMFAARPFIGGRKPGFIYFGGGTPSYLSSEQLTALTEKMKSLLPWDEAEEVTFEAEPGTLTEHKLKIIRGLGVTRLSLGVEHWDDEILSLNGRAHLSKEVLRAWEFIKSLDFPQVNVDLIAGMLGETEDKWRDAVAKTLALQPDSVTIYQMEVPYNTTIYKEMKASGKLTAPVADWATKRRWVSEAFAEFEKIGYTVASAYTVVKNKAKTKFVYRDRLWAGADLIGLGVASFSHVGGTHFQNLDSFGEYIAAVNDGRLPVNRALTPTPKERLIREMILQLKLGRIDAGYFRKKFGAEIVAEFEASWKQLKEWGVITLDGDRIELSREGLLQVDRLLHEFFLPEHRTGRYT
ncbi:MAG TPA: coproporphyrinogen-III oxidase family protein [Planctomycetota bacterium]|nr:coproporphyrinogen-III oxidase family protein [Planctomycetota bacterium]